MTLGESTFKDFEINRKISEASARSAILLKDFTDRWDGLIDLYARDLERFAADFYAATDSFKAEFSAIPDYWMQAHIGALSKHFHQKCLENLFDANTSALWLALTRFKTAPDATMVTGWPVRRRQNKE